MVIRELKKIPEIEEQRCLLERKIMESDNLLDPEIINESKKLDLIINKYINKSQNKKILLIDS